MRILSYDLFDTLISRYFYKSTDLFYKAGEIANQKQIHSFNSSQWGLIRIKSEIEARSSSPYEEITLNEIYDLIAKKFSLSNDIIANS